MKARVRMSFDRSAPVDSSLTVIDVHNAIKRAENEIAIAMKELWRSTGLHAIVDASMANDAEPDRDAIRWVPL